MEKNNNCSTINKEEIPGSEVPHARHIVLVMTFITPQPLKKESPENKAVYFEGS